MVNKYNGHEFDISELLEAEHREIVQRRKIKKQPLDVSNDSLGIALSGGGIRSATLCLGVIEEFNKRNLLSKADYLSSVSGGGYLASYIHSSLNKKNYEEYGNLFDKKDVINRMRSNRTHLLIWPNRAFSSVLAFILIYLTSFLLNWLWLIAPIMIYKYLEQPTPIKCTVLIALSIFLGMAVSSNWTSLHSYYKKRLRKAYLWKAPNIHLHELKNQLAPYPLINATVHISKDKYLTNEGISYRGKINTNYFLFSPLFCGSQVTRYARTSDSHHRKITLATAMATSGAAVNTFMGNIRFPSIWRLFFILTNVKTGYLTPSPLKRSFFPTFWPAYTWMEFTNRANNTSNRVLVSDGGHIENLGVYELLRRKVKTIFIIDGGQDRDYLFYDLRNVIVRAKNELGISIHFNQENDPLINIKSNLITGDSKSHYSIAQIQGLPNSYAENYMGILVYIKSSTKTSNIFTLRSLKRSVRSVKKSEKEQHDRLSAELDHTMYRTYTPDFPHQSTAEQFFRKEQWDAYYHLGKNIGANVLNELSISDSDSQLKIHERCTIKSMNR